MAKAKSKIIKRNSTRFTSEPQTIAHIDFEMTTAKFVSGAACLPYSEAMKGCALISRKIKGLKEGHICRVKVGEMAPLRAEVAWIKTIDRDVIKIGFKYLE